MQSNSSIVVSAAAGALGGALVVVLLFNSPQVARLFDSRAGGMVLPGGADQDTAVDKSINGEARLSYESLVVEAVKKSNPAVVSIIITKDVPIIERYYEELPGNPFDDLLGNNFYSPFRLRVPQYRQRGTQEQEIGGGSGFLVSPDGMIVTNRHVVDQDDVDYTVFTNDGTSFDAEVREPPFFYFG